MRSMARVVRYEQPTEIQEGYSDMCAEASDVLLLRPKISDLIRIATGGSPERIASGDSPEGRPELRQAGGCEFGTWSSVQDPNLISDHTNT
jgi:hypothetical protein